MCLGVLVHSFDSEKQLFHTRRPSSFFIVCLTHSSVFLSGYLSYAGLEKKKKKKRPREAAPLICSLTYTLKAGAARKCFSSVSCRRWTLWCVASEAAHIVHLLRVNDHPGPRVQKRKDRPRLNRDRLLSGPEMCG